MFMFTLNLARPRTTTRCSFLEERASGSRAARYFWSPNTQCGVSALCLEKKALCCQDKCEYKSKTNNHNMCLLLLSSASCVNMVSGVGDLSAFSRDGPETPVWDLFTGSICLGGSVWHVEYVYTLEMHVRAVLR